MNITIKNVPEGAEDKVKEMAAIAIERFIRDKDVVVSNAVKDKFEKDVDAIRTANGLDKKFEKIEKPEEIELYEEINDGMSKEV